MNKNKKGEKPIAISNSKYINKRQTIMFHEIYLKHIDIVRNILVVIMDSSVYTNLHQNILYINVLIFLLYVPIDQMMNDDA
jgi:hypothetical protein